MGKDKQMAEYLCETCKHRKGKLAVYHRIDSQGIERSYSNIVKVRCRASRKNPNMVRDAVAEIAYMEPRSICGDYKERRRGKHGK